MAEFTKIDIDQLSGAGQLTREAARLWPDHPAVAQPAGAGWQSLTFSELDRLAARQMNQLREAGLQPAQRIALMVPPGIQFVSLVFALFQARARIILIDPGIGRKNLIDCLASVEPQGMVGIPRAHLARWLFRRRFPDARLNFTSHGRSWPGCQKLATEPGASAAQGQPAPAVDRADAAAIIFTSGSTGPPKGVAYTHGNFLTQALEIRDFFGIPPGGADISGFPLFALFNTAMGKTTVFPKMDFTRPASVDPEHFFKAASDFAADQSFGSPALWNTVGRRAKQQGRTLPTLRRVMSAGAPVPAHVLKTIRETIAPDGEAWTPYGATEALPVACNSASSILGETAAKTDQGAGVCVGRRFARIQWRIVEIDDGPIARIEDTRPVPGGEIGELIVRGPVVTREYTRRETDRPSATALAKISDGDTFWHRMGDVGYLDEHDRFWFCGRKSQRVVTRQQTLFTVPCESILNTHPAIYRSALVGIGETGNMMPVMVAEPWPEFWPAGTPARTRLIGELQELASQHALTRSVRHVLLQRNLPVDIRHNSKIFRERIRSQAARRLAKTR